MRSTTTGVAGWVLLGIHPMDASGMSQEEISNALTNEKVFRRNGQWFPVVIRRALAAREQGFPAEPIPDGVFRSRSKQFRRSRKEYRSVP
jgi:hypothetical protein